MLETPTDMILASGRKKIEPIQNPLLAQLRNMSPFPLSGGKSGTAKSQPRFAQSPCHHPC
jgi:hypothetical protein